MNKVEQVTVTEGTCLREALRVLDRSGTTILLLVDPDGVLLRTVTDGDIRRLLLADHTLDENLELLNAKEPLVIKETQSQEDALQLMDKHGVNQIPVIDTQCRPIKLYLRHEIQPRIMLSVPHMGEYERQYIEEAFESNWIAPLGPNVDAFEEELASHVSSGHAAAVSSGTAAIHLALRLLGVGPGDVVLCSSFTFVASANPILYQGATPVFIDSEPQTWNMSPDALERALLDCIKSGNTPKAIIVVHLYGLSADMERIVALSEAYGVQIIEDAAESLGALHRGRHTGTFGKFGVFSFNGNKIITTSGGGMLISDDKEMIEKARFLSTQARDNAPHYEHSEIGYNYRMSNILAGIGRGQLKVLSDRVLARREVYERYKSALSDVSGLEWMPEPDHDYSNRWLSVLSLKKGKVTVEPKQLIESLLAKNIEARHVWKPMHRQPLFSECNYYSHDSNSFCDYLFETGICLPSASNMTEEQQDSVISALKELLV